MKSSLVAALWVLLLARACVPSLARATAATPASPTASRATVWSTLAAMEAAGHWRAADSLDTALIAELDTPVIRDSASLARAMVKRVAYLRILGQLRDGRAVTIGERAVAIAERLHPRDVVETCRAHSVLNMAFVDMGLGDSALVHALRAEEIARSANPPNDSLLAIMCLREAQAHSIRGDYAAGIRAGRVARGLISRAKGDDALELGLIHNDLGRSLTYLGDFDSARVELEASVRIAERHFAANPQRLELALSGLMTLERRLGHVAIAVDLGQRVYELCVAREGVDGPQTHIHRSNLAYALMALGDHARARDLLEREVVYGATTMQPADPSLLQMRAALADACISLGDEAAARTQLDLVDSLLHANPGTDPTCISYCAAVRAGLERDAGRYAASRRVLLEAARVGSQELSGRSDLIAQVYETLRDPSERAIGDSIGEVMDALGDSTAISRTKNWPMTLTLRARAEARLGERERAREHAARADSLARDRFSWELASLSDREALELSDETADAAQELVETARPDRPGELSDAWDAVIRRRGQVREAVAGRRDLLGSADTALAGAHARWVAALRHHAQIVVSGSFEGADPARRERFESSRAAVQVAERQYAALSATSGHVRAPPTLARVRARLGHDDALVAFVHTEPSTGEAHLVALIARGTDGAPVLIRLGNEDRIADAARAWLSRLATPPPANPHAARAAEDAARLAGQSVRRLVWDPLQGALGDAKELQIVPAGPLDDLPWLALPTTPGHYLADAGVHVHVLPAERELLYEPPVRAKGGLLVVGDPDFDLAPAAVPSLAQRMRGLAGGCGPADVRLGTLPGAREEARAIAELWARDSTRGPALLLTGADASEERFKQLAPGRSVLHLATHGILTRDSCERAPLATRGVGGVASTDSPPQRTRRRAHGGSADTNAHGFAKPGSENPEPSPWLGREVWLAFAGANRAQLRVGDENEGWLTADEVVTLDLRGTDRVVLSACQSGVVDRWTQEALLGMRRAFHLAGARCVVASQWPIADVATREWMDAFYASPSASAGTAAQDACRAVLSARRALRRTTHPFYWAAFTVTGD